MSRAAILHVTSPFGGGVARHLGDLARAIGRPQLVWHAAAGADVIEEAGRGRYHALAGDCANEALARWLRARRVGLVHLHQLGEAARSRAEWASAALGVPRVATLHDVLFLHPDAFSADDPLAPEASWLARTSQALRGCAAVLAPSRWLADLASRHVPGLEVEVVPNGTAPAAGGEDLAPREEFASARPERVVAVLGALGPHKGSGLVEETARRLDGSGIAIVVVGYLEERFLPGWAVPGRLFVHGAYAEAQAAALLRAYGACLVVMPNRVPESFSYALSDAWTAGVPVLAAPAGALAERIGAHGGGWLLPARFDAASLAAEIRRLAGGEREPERARVQSALARPDAGRCPSLDAMTRSLDAFYARFGIDPAAPGEAGEAAIESLLARNLDASLFRAELVRLCDEFAQANGALEAERKRARDFEAEARGWIAKLEADVRAVQEELRRATQARDALEKEADLLRLNKEALERLPSPVRRLLLKLAFDARR